MENVEVDTAIILEGQIKERVQLIVAEEVRRAVVNHIGKIINDEKNKMMMEVAIKIGQMLKGYEAEGRKPLWESSPEDFGMTANDVKQRFGSKEVVPNIDKDLHAKETNDATDNSISN